MENIRLNQPASGDVPTSEDIEAHIDTTYKLSRQNKEHLSRCCKLCTWKAVVIFMLCVVLLSTNVYLWHQKSSSSNSMNEDLSSSKSDVSSSLKSAGLFHGSLEGSDNNNAVHNINVDMRNDFRLQECQGSQFKQTFPDVDYALFGYNILKGYPLAVGHDPGFTYPIFTADYSEGRQSADCRYSIPRGLAVVPDVSCVTSFTSKTVQTKYEFSKSLSVSASVSGGGWGVSFSASAGYKESSSEIATGDSVFILSSAKCVYYFSKLLADDAPRLSNSFLKWVYRLNSTDTKDVYIDFFDIYGTHYLSYVTFGARFTYEHKMSSKTFQSERSKGVNVAVQASYSGMFSVGGGFSMDSSQKQSAMDFSKNVETRTITVGAPPPANGDAMTWASTVKDSPVPMEYKLESIDKLFTEKYMKNINVNYRNISHNIQRFKFEYCKYLKESGQLDSCESLTPGIVLIKTRLHGHYRYKHLSFTECIDFCLDDVVCEAITYCLTCKEGDRVCYMYAEMSKTKPDQFPFQIGWGKQLYTKSASFTDKGDEWQSIVFVTKIVTHSHFVNTNIIGNERGSENTDRCINSRSTCESFCKTDVYCEAFTYSSCTGKIKNCLLYSHDRIKSLKHEVGVETYFISNREVTEKTTVAP